MRVHLGTDHAGLEFSQQLQQHLRDAGHEVVDHGPISYDPVDDYPSFCINAARAVARDQAAGVEALGVVFGGSGNGEQIAANKVSGIRAALVSEPLSAAMSRKHNNANILCLGARMTGPDLATECVRAFLATAFDPGDDGRHRRRVQMITELENS